jgi:hypothetical protein
MSSAQTISVMGNVMNVQTREEIRPPFAIRPPCPCRERDLITRVLAEVLKSTVDKPLDIRRVGSLTKLEIHCKRLPSKTFSSSADTVPVRVVQVASRGTYR